MHRGPAADSPEKKPGFSRSCAARFVIFSWRTGFGVLVGHQGVEPPRVNPFSGIGYPHRRVLSTRRGLERADTVSVNLVHVAAFTLVGSHAAPCVTVSSSFLQPHRHLPPCRSIDPSLLRLPPASSPRTIGPRWRLAARRQQPVSRRCTSPRVSARLAASLQLPRSSAVHAGRPLWKMHPVASPRPHNAA